MEGVIAYFLLIGGAFTLAASLLFTLRAVKLI
jgi:Cytochrome B6-F complex subunit VI (PetL)